MMVMIQKCINEIIQDSAEIPQYRKRENRVGNSRFPQPTEPQGRQTSMENEILHSFVILEFPNFRDEFQI
jgi:hypothetical protein